MRARMRVFRYGRGPTKRHASGFDAHDTARVIANRTPSRREECTTMQRSKRTRVLIATAVIVIGALALAACGPAPAPCSSAASAVRARTDYLRLINGRGTLAFDGYLEGNAQLHAERLAN